MNNLQVIERTVSGTVNIPAGEKWLVHGFNGSHTAIWSTLVAADGDNIWAAAGAANSTVTDMAPAGAGIGPFETSIVFTLVTTVKVYMYYSVVGRS